jgi:hypothetical protein
MRDHVAGKEAQFHPRLALRHAIAHGRHAARDLGRGTAFARGLLDAVGVILEGLMGAQHVVIGGDDADIRGAGGNQRVLVAPHRGIGMGLVAAAEVSAARALFARRRIRSR